jgi:hypothetical protein
MLATCRFLLSVLDRESSRKTKAPTTSRDVLDGVFWRRPIDSFAPANHPSDLRLSCSFPWLGSLRPAVLPPSPSYGRDRRVKLCTPETKNPTGKPAGFLLWRRPTLTRPIAVLPSGLQRFTSVFGMGTGGATALLSPEFRAGFFGTEFW